MHRPNPAVRVHVPPTLLRQHPKNPLQLLKWTRLQKAFLLAHAVMKTPQNSYSDPTLNSMATLNTLRKKTGVNNEGIEKAFPTPAQTIRQKTRISRSDLKGLSPIPQIHPILETPSKPRHPFNNPSPLAVLSTIFTPPLQLPTVPRPKIPPARKNNLYLNSDITPIPLSRPITNTNTIKTTTTSKHTITPN